MNNSTGRVLKTCFETTFINWLYTIHMIEILYVYEKTSVLLFAFLGADLSFVHLRAFYTKVAAMFIDDTNFAVLLISALSC